MCICVEPRGGGGGDLTLRSSSSAGQSQNSGRRRSALWAGTRSGSGQEGRTRLPIGTFV